MKKQFNKFILFILFFGFLPVSFVNAQEINYNKFNGFEKFSIRTFCTFAYCEKDPIIKRENNLNFFERVSLKTFCTFSVCESSKKDKEKVAVVNLSKDDSGNTTYQNFYYPQGEIEIHRGARGHQGERGDSGKDGSDGSRGQKGDSGKDGSGGSRGPRGYDGSDGTNGVDGIGAVTTQINITVATSDGIFNSGGFVGYEAANNMCSLEFIGSHFCRTDEIISYIAGSGASGLVNGSTAWIAEGPPGYTANSNDCNGWTSNNNIMLGAFWEFNTNGGGMGWLTNCAVVKSVACCQ